MAGDKGLFAPMPLRAMADEISGLQARVLICVSSHDRLSMTTGKGQGCRASNDRMAQMVGCSYARLCSTLTELVALGYLLREKLGRHTVYRVIYDDRDRLLFGNVSRRSKGCGSGNQDPPIGCQEIPESGGNQPFPASQYIPLNGGRDSVETGKENSSEEAHLAARGLSKGSKTLPIEAELSRFERALKAHPESLDLPAWIEWLGEVADDHCDNTAVTHRAMRLAGDAELALDALRDTVPEDDIADVLARTTKALRASG